MQEVPIVQFLNFPLIMSVFDFDVLQEFVQAKRPKFWCGDGRKVELAAVIFLFSKHHINKQRMFFQVNIGDHFESD